MACVVLYHAHRYSPAPLGMPLSVEVLSFGAARTTLLSHTACRPICCLGGCTEGPGVQGRGGHSEARIKYG